MSTSSASSSSTSSSRSIYEDYPSNQEAVQAYSSGGEEHTTAGSPVTPGPSSPAAQRSSSRGAEDDHQTWAEFLDSIQPERRDSGRETPVGAYDDNSSVAGRKRRLTGSNHGSPGLERRQSRTRQSHGSPSSGSGLVREVSWRNESGALGSALGSSRDRAIDISSSPPSVSRSRQINSLRHRESSFTDYRLPRWQPDSEVSKCPICETTFSFWYRKHHCRKCGRVVCASCSPHRITIPRQFIVHSPEAQRPLSAIIQPSPSAAQVINLIDDEDDNGSTGFPSPRRPRARVPSNPALGGGEEVRLCNPCVPDPNPEPPRRYSAYGEFGSPWGAQGHHGADSRHSSHRPSASMPSHAYQAEHPGVHIGARPGAPRESFSPSPAFNYAGPPNSQSFPAGYRSSGSPRRHGQFPPSADTFTGDSRQRRAYTQGHGYRTNTSTGRSRRLTNSPMDQPRQGVHENDLCPVCNLILPPRAANGSEEAREIHIRSCIERLGGQTQTESEGQPPAGAAIGMLHFVATEKDCTGDEGTPQECTICMEEYEVGAELTRLECLCKFHKACIVDWFQRKQECPVHKVA